MAAPPADPSLGVPAPQGTWSPASDPWGLLDDALWNSTAGEDDFQASSPVHYIVQVVALLVSLCGIPGNGVVIWLLEFSMERSPFSLFFFHLTRIDLVFLLSKSVHSTLELLNNVPRGFYLFFEGLRKGSHLAGLGLRVAVSSELWVSVLWPTWYRRRRSAHLASIVCDLNWLLFFCMWGFEYFCSGFVSQCDSFQLSYLALAITASLVLAVSGLMLLVRVQCGPGRPQRSRLDVTVLLSVLASLLLTLPHTVGHLVDVLAPWKPFNFLRSTITSLFLLLNSAVNPFIYFFVGWHGQRPGRAPPREALQRALRDEEEGTEQGDTPVT